MSRAFFDFGFFFFRKKTGMFCDIFRRSEQFDRHRERMLPLDKNGKIRYNDGMK